MSVVTTTGTGTLTSLVVSSGTNLILPQYQYTSLFQGANVTVTGSGTNVLILGRVQTSHDDACQVDINVDSVNVFEGSAGEQIIVRLPLSVGSHTIEFTGFALANDVTAEVFGLTAIDLGL